MHLLLRVALAVAFTTTSLHTHALAQSPKSTNVTTVRRPDIEASLVGRWSYTRNCSIANIFGGSTAWNEEGEVEISSVEGDKLSGRIKKRWTGNIIQTYIPGTIADGHIQGNHIVFTIVEDTVLGAQEKHIGIIQASPGKPLQMHGAVISGLPPRMTCKFSAVNLNPHKNEIVSVAPSARKKLAANPGANSKRKSSSAPTNVPNVTNSSNAVPTSSTNSAETDAEKAEFTKFVSAAVAARHGGIMPKTMSEADAEVAAKAAIKWRVKKTAERTKRALDAMKSKPLPSTGYAEVYMAKEAITKLMRNPASAVFGEVFFVNDRKSATGYYLPVVCGTVNGENGFGGMTGQMRFVAVMSDAIRGLWLEGTTPQITVAREWNRFCAGSHN